jgi:predicted Zn-dependent protease
MRLLLCMIAGFSLVAIAQDRPAGGGVDSYSREKEIALGAKLAAEARQRTTPLDYPAFQEYIERLGGRLASYVPEPRCVYTFSSIADDPAGPAHEPLSFPGGFVFVSAQLMLEAQSEPEFAGMLAHAMSHCAERHGTRAATRGEVAQHAAAPLIFMGGWNGLGAQASLMPLSLRQWQGRFEIEADALAAMMLNAAGYDPRALAGYLRRIGAPAERLTALDQVLSSLAAPPLTPPSDDFMRLQQEIRGLFPARTPAAPHLVK